MTDYFRSTRALALYPTETDGFSHRFALLAPYFASFTSLNYAEACYRDGARAAARLIRETIEREGIGLVFACPFASDYLLTPEFYASLRDRCRVVFWFADDPSYFDSYSKYFAQAGDAVFTSDGLCVAAYSKLEIPAAPHFDMNPGEHGASGEFQKDIDVSFVGDLRKRGRRGYIEALRREGIPVVVYGRGSENGMLPAGRLAEIFKRSRINLGFSRISDLDWRNGDDPLLSRVRQNTARPREIAAAGAFCLTEISPAIGELFKVGEEIDCFADEKELIAKVRYYLAEPEKRESMAAAAAARTAKEYNQAAVTDRLISNMAAMLSAPPPRAEKILLSRAYLEREANCLVFSACLMAYRGRWKAAALTAFSALRRGITPLLRGAPAGAARAARLLAGKFTKAR